MLLPINTPMIIGDDDNDDDENNSNDGADETIAEQ